MFKTADVKKKNSDNAIDDFKFTTDKEERIIENPKNKMNHQNSYLAGLKNKFT